MPFAAALSTATPASEAVHEVLGKLSGVMPGPADLCVVFLSPTHAGAAPFIAATLHTELRPGALIGCVGEAVAGTGREIEQGPALSVWLGAWAGRLTVEPFQLDARQTPDGPALFGWPDALDDAVAQRSTLLVLGDPFTFPAAELFLPRLNDDHPGLRVFGGMASGAVGPGETPLLFADGVVETGAVGVLLTGDAPVRGLVSQGCRSVGPVCEVTAGAANVITQLDGQPALARLQAIYHSLPAHDQTMFGKGPNIGLAIDAFGDLSEPADYVVRNLLGIDRAAGAIAITDHVREGQAVQFQVRDAEAADEDLRTLLKRYRERWGVPAGALMFTCNGRGTRLFGTSGHDAEAIREAFGEVPLAGAFAAGELGPVGGQNFLHGYTASVALFE